MLGLNLYMLYVNNISIKLGERIKVGLEEHRVEKKKNGNMAWGISRAGKCRLAFGQALLCPKYGFESSQP